MVPFRLSLRLLLAIPLGILSVESACASHPFAPARTGDLSEEVASDRAPSSGRKRGASVLQRRPAGPEVAGGAPALSATSLNRSTTVDVILDSRNTLQGRFVDIDGAAIDGALVTLSNGKNVVARTTTDAQGLFRIRNVASGNYRLACGSAAGRLRCWSQEAAPPNAISGDVTFQDGVIRGQTAFLAPAIGTSTLVTGAATAGAVVGGVSASEGFGTSSRTSPATTPQPAPSVPTETAGNSFASFNREPAMIAAMDPFDPQTEYRVINGRMVRVVKPSVQSTGDGFQNDFGDPRDQPVREALSLQLDDLSDGVPASP